MQELRKTARYLRDDSTLSLCARRRRLRAIRASAIEPTATVVEFYNASLNHYFITAYPEEAAMLDAGYRCPGGLAPV